jgi:RNA polymerase sigma factor (sigma-70 family)
VTIEAPTTSPQEIPFAEFVALRKRIVADGFKTLSEHEHTDLIRRTKLAEKRASELFVLVHERLIFKFAKYNKAKKRSFAAIDVEETMQESRIALLRAVESFDPDKGKFATYLRWWLRHAARKQNSGDPIIRIDPNRFGDGPGHKADPDLVAICRNVVDFDAPSDSEEGLTVEETAPSDGDDAETVMIEGEGFQRLKQFVGSTMNGLSVRDRAIIEMRWFGEETRTLEEVGQRFTLSKERVRQIEARIFDDIRKRIDAFRSKSPTI